MVSGGGCAPVPLGFPLVGFLQQNPVLSSPQLLILMELLQLPSPGQSSCRPQENIQLLAADGLNWIETGAHL